MSAHSDVLLTAPLVLTLTNDLTTTEPPRGPFFGARWFTAWKEHTAQRDARRALKEERRAAKKSERQRRKAARR